MGCKFCCECEPACLYTPECNCRCGESIAFTGVFVFCAAILFWIIGTTFQVVAPYGPDWEKWFHPLNMWFFKLGLVLIVWGVLSAVVMRQGKAFSREKQQPFIQVADEENAKEQVAPTPYTMLPA